MKKKWKNLFLLKLASSKAENDSKTSQQNGNNNIMPSANGHASESALTSTLSRQQRSGVSSVGVYTGLDNSVQIIAVNGETSTSFEYIPLLKNAGSSEIRALFLKKLKLCGCMFDFSDMKSAKSREVKLQTLAELGEFISNGFFGLDEDIAHMVSLNIFRPLVPPHRHRNIMPEGLEPEEEEPALDPSWPHLQYVYEILLKYVVSPETDPKIAKKYIDHFFLLRLLDLFDSEDSREREYLKTILHRIYGRFMVHRPFIRKAINNIFYRFIFETEKHNGIAELLEILGSIISGFALPLKDEYKSFLVRALIPLHKSKNSAAYQQQLTYCVTQFIEKDPTLADNVIQGLLKYWPITNSQKEILFLGEIEEVLEGTQSEEFQRCMVPLFRQIGRCLNSFHFQVAERAFLLLNNDHILRLVAENREVIFPLIFGALERNRSHWNQTVHTSTLNVRKMFLEMDLELFKKCEQAYKENEAKTRGFDEKRDATWKRLEAVAASRTSSSEAKLAQPVPNDNVMGFGSMTKFTARVVINLTWKFVFNLVFAFIRAFQLPWVLRCCTEALLQRRRNERIEFSVL